MKKSIMGVLALLWVSMIVLGGCSSPKVKIFSLKKKKKITVTSISGEKIEVTDEDIMKLFEIRMKRIFRFDSEEADKKIEGLEKEIARVKNDIEHIIPYSIAYYERIKTKYGKGRERK